jgi:hypothetical protein
LELERRKLLTFPLSPIQGKDEQNVGTISKKYFAGYQWNYYMKAKSEYEVSLPVKK